MVDASRRALAQAAVALLLGRQDEATAALDKAEASVGRSMDPGFAKLGVAQVAALRAQVCQGHLTGSEAATIVPVKLT